MIEIVGDLWLVPCQYRIITTNGAVRSDGCAVMGRGCAAQAKFYMPSLPRALGTKLKAGGNHVYEFPEWSLFTFPVKHSWEQPADLPLIAQSARELRGFAEDRPEAIFILPRPGCGNGQLEWAVVEPLLRSLPDNILVIDLPRK